MGGAGNNSYYVPYSRQFVASIGKYIGRHSLKAGGEWRSISDDGIDFDGSNGFMAFTFDDRFTRKNAAVSGGGGSDIASLLLGFPAHASGFQTTKLFENVTYVSTFFQDDIRITPKLVVNAGIRSEHQSGLKERNNNIIVGFATTALHSLSATLCYPVKAEVQLASPNA